MGLRQAHTELSKTRPAIHRPRDKEQHRPFKAAQKELDIMLELSILKGKAREKKNPKGYISMQSKGN